jgi:hypothetical protein
MSYLRSVAGQTLGSFRPKRTRSFALENMLRVEESFVEAPRPASLPGPALFGHAALSGTGSDRGSPSGVLDDGRAAPAQAPLRPTDAPPQPTAVPRALESRREHPDAIEESVDFDGGERSHVPRDGRETPDPREVESLMGRIRALTGQASPSNRPSVPPAQTDAANPAGVPARAGREAPFDARSPVDALRVVPVRARYLADGADGEERAADTARAVKAPGTVGTRPDARHEAGSEPVQVSFGSIVVHVDPAPVPAAAQPARPAPASAVPTEADGRWARSYLDRN